jgi:tetratricopeptide (TPR) repeat protein
MSDNRLEQLLGFLQEDPKDAFTLYAIATEYTKTAPLKALEFYETLLREHEGYVATYYHAAKLYAQLGKRAEAELTFQKGLDISNQQNDRHAYRELQSAYNSFLFDEED